MKRNCNWYFPHTTISITKELLNIELRDATYKKYQVPETGSSSD